MQSNQRLCCLPPRYYNTSSFYIRNFKPLASLCSWAGRFESYLVANPADRFSRDVPLVRCWPSKDSVQPGHRPVWSESLLCAWRKLGSLATHWAHNENSDQTGQMPRLNLVFAGPTLILLVLSCHGSFNSFHHQNKSTMKIPKQAHFYAMQKQRKITFYWIKIWVWNENMLVNECCAFPLIKKEVGGEYFTSFISHLSLHHSGFIS